MITHFDMSTGEMIEPDGPEGAAVSGRPAPHSCARPALRLMTVREAAARETEQPRRREAVFLYPVMPPLD